MNKELIEKMKNNRVPNILLTDEEWQCLKNVGGGLWYSTIEKKWKLIRHCGHRDSDQIHRIHPDWTFDEESYTCWDEFDKMTPEKIKAIQKAWDKLSKHLDKFRGESK